jgi:Protein of unknown function (DUF3990)
MKVYHGSFVKIETIDLTKCKPFKDFGMGFYVTKFKEQAEFWAIRNGRKYDNDGFVTNFEFNDYAFDNEQIKSIRFETYNDEWLEFVVLNRKSKTQPHDYDIVEGPVADDKIQRRINDYLNNEISKETFLNELKWHEETHQICFCTVFSLQFLEQEGSGKFISKLSHISEPIVERLVTDFGLDELTATDKLFTSKIFSQITTISTELYLKNWTEIYDLLIAELNLKSNKK